MSIAEIIIVFLLPLSGVHITLLVIVLYKLSKIEVLTETHHERLEQLERRHL